MKLTEKQQRIFQWTSKILLLVVMLAGATAGFGFLPIGWTQAMGVVAALGGIAARWFEQQLPVREKASGKS